MANKWHQFHSRRWSALWRSSSRTWRMGKPTFVKSQDSSHGHCFSMSIFWALQHIWWVARGTFFPWTDPNHETLMTQHCLMAGARELKTGDWVPWSKQLNKIQGFHVFCVTKENWNRHHVSLKQSCLPTVVLFPRFRGSQATGDGFVCTALGQVQPALFPRSASHLVQTDWTGSISSLTASLLLFLLLRTNRNFQSTAKRVMTSTCAHLCFGW